jgi:hypothetical protein
MSIDIPSQDHFYEVVDVVAATSEPKPGLTQKYMVALWDTGMRVDPAARAAIMFSAPLESNKSFPSDFPIHAPQLCS